MKFDQKIEEMKASGKLSSEQAEMLGRSLGHSGVPTPPQNFHGSLPTKAIVIALAILLVGILYIFSGGQNVPIEPQTIQTVSETLNQAGAIGVMNKSSTNTLSILLIALPVIISLIWFVLTYNGLVNKEEDVLSSWAQVETNYQRRADLVPNLVKTVQAFADHEGAVLTDIAALRSKADVVGKQAALAKEATQGAAGHLEDEAYLAQLDQSQQNVSNEVKGLMVMVENYPALKSSEQFLTLQSQIEGTENRIAVSRMVFNEKVGEFNSAIRKMPGSLAAGMGDFKRKAYFKSDAGAEKVVPVDFNHPENHE